MNPCFNNYCILYLDTFSFSSQQMELTWVESTQCKVIMANVRHYAGGAYLKAVTKKGHEREAKITVEFTGNAFEQTTGILKKQVKQIVGSLSSDIFELRTSTGSQPFSLLIFLDTTKFVLLSFFTLIETICSNICSKSRIKSAKILLPVDVHRSKTSLLKLTFICLGLLASVPFHIRINEVVDVRTAILSEIKFLACIDNQIFLPMVLRCASFARERPPTISYNKNWLLSPLALIGIWYPFCIGKFDPVLGNSAKSTGKCSRPLRSRCFCK